MYSLMAVAICGRPG